MNAQNIARAHALIVEANGILERELNAVPVPPIITPPVIAPPTPTASTVGSLPRRVRLQ